MKNLILSFLTTAAFANAVSAHAQSFELTSADIAAGALIAEKFVFNGFGCTGGNVSPALSWKTVLAARQQTAPLQLHGVRAKS